MSMRSENLRRFNRKRFNGQAMAEFALVLPLLLVVVFGLLEVGRLLFTYASVTNASREAARYGSAYGLNTSNVPRYQDCDGIREAAKRTGFLLGLQDEDILIYHDTGPGDTSPTLYCDGIASDTSIVFSCGDRIIVTVEEDFAPVASLVPLDPMSFDSTSKRTFTGIIELTEDYSCD